MTSSINPSSLTPYSFPCFYALFLTFLSYDIQHAIIFDHCFMVIGQFTLECRRRVFSTFEGNGHELSWQSIRIDGRWSLLRWIDPLFEGY
jgi:hypothetical protein